MADTTPTTPKTSVSKIPMRSASTRRLTSYRKSIRRYDLKYGEPSTPDISSTASTRCPTLTPATSGNVSPDAQSEATHNHDRLKTNSLKTFPTGTAVLRSTPAPTTPNAPTTRISKVAHFNRRALTTSTFTPPAKPTPGQFENGDDTCVPPDPLLQRTISLLHAELETLMQALYLRLQTAAHLSVPYVRAFEELAADTLYEGMGERIHADVEDRRAKEGDTRKRYADDLEHHLLREAVRNTRRYNRGLHFFEEHDTKSTLTEVRSRWRLHEADGELTTSSLIDEHGGLADIEAEYEVGLANLVKCKCRTCLDEMDQLIAEYWGAVQRSYVAVQEAESRMRSQDVFELEAHWSKSGPRSLQDELRDGVSDYTSEWLSTDSMQDEQDVEMKQDIDEDETRWIAKVDAYLLDQDGDEFGDEVLRETRSAQATHESEKASTQVQP